MIKMFTQWRIDKLKIKIAGLKSKAVELNKHSVLVQSSLYDDQIFSTAEKLARSEEKLSILEAKLMEPADD